MHRLIATAILVPSLAAASALVQSDEHVPHAGPYLEIGAGQAVLENDPLERRDALGANIGDGDTGYRLFAGYQFTPFVAMEANYLDFGDLAANGSTAPRAGHLTTAELAVDADGLGLALVGVMPFHYGISLHARLGMLAGQVKMAGTDRVNGNTIVQGEALGGDTAPFYGIGATYRINRLMMRAAYERYDIGESGEALETHLVSASLGYHF
ncbi:porin family protein [Halomonas cerina]|uniref:OOP family OmpA-OmpF porin n=1 Tax=Halomonas cerina TaxID=447424 RepID=A0A839VIT7_9GAMM|nr:porin family protein [Halomonas cerina]MBB3192296.1 OOP family OmpA-OmpF porin [Halomonas cerina]